MSLATDLLEQAEHLARRESRKPKQASLRRAVSTAYYALFHLLADEGAAMLVTQDSGLRPLVRRAFIHSEMKSASRLFATNQAPAYFQAAVGGRVIPPDLRLVATTFVELQTARHEADYKVDRMFARAEVSDLIDKVADAFQKWSKVRKSRAARAYLAALLLVHRFKD